MDEMMQKLKSWRVARADLEQIEPFRVLSNNAMQDIAERMPRNRAGLLAIRGIKEKKFVQYGAEILAIINGAIKNSEEELVLSGVREGGDEKIFSVSEYLDVVNIGLRSSAAKIKGEVSSCDFRGNYLFFTLKDSEDESVISCFMWQREYRMSGVALITGMEVTAHGFPEIYKPSGRLSFHADALELVGEGALKKAYEVLKRKLEGEGLFLAERKRPIPEYIEKIGLITSSTGAVIHDFLNNLGKFGYKIQFCDSRVEGQLAVPDLLRAIRSFRNKDIEVLVIIRGGGSLESLLAFNNEMLVREIARFSKPVICGIGHDKDVPLAALAADVSVSTPTAVTRALNSSWERATAELALRERDLVTMYQEVLFERKYRVEEYGREIKDYLIRMAGGVQSMGYNMQSAFARMAYEQKRAAEKIGEWKKSIVLYFVKAIQSAGERIIQDEKELAAHNPERQLHLGYSIARIKGTLVRSVDNVHAGDLLDIAVRDGMIEAMVENVKKSS